MKILTKKDVLSLFPNAVARTYPPGQIVIYQGDQPAHMFFVYKGSVKYYDIDQNGNEKILHLIGKSGFFPLFFAVGNYTEIQAFYTSMDEVEVLLIPVEDYKHMVANDIVFCNLILQWFVHEVEHMVQRIKSLEKSDAKSKVIEALNYLLLRHSTEKRFGWYRVNFALSQQTLADLTGLSRETVSISLKEIDDLKLIRYPKQLCAELHKERINQNISN